MAKEALAASGSWPTVKIMLRALLVAGKPVLLTFGPTSAKKPTMQNENEPWLIRLGKEELALVRELGWESGQVIEAQQRFRNGFEAVKAIRKAYENSSSQEDS